MGPLAKVADSLTAVSIPGEPNTLPAEETARFAAEAGMKTDTADDVDSALKKLAETDPTARILICGSLYLAGEVLRRNEA